MKLKIFTILIAIAALLIAVLGLLKANQAFKLSLVDIELEERNALLTPVFDQESEKWTFLAIYQVDITNQGPLDITLQSISQHDDGAGFLVPLIGQEIVNQKLEFESFLVEPMLTEIEQNPRLIKSLSEKTFDTVANVDIVIESGQSKSLRFGVMVNAYDGDKNPLAQVVLLSMKFNFENGKIRIFRRGIPIHLIK